MLAILLFYFQHEKKLNTGRAVSQAQSQQIISRIMLNGFSLLEQLNNHTALELTEKKYIITSQPTNVKGRKCGSTAEHIKIL